MRLSLFHKINVACIILLLGSFSLSAQVKIQSVSPDKTDENIRVIHGPHIALYDPQVHSRGKLIFMIEGTGATAESMRGIDSIFATLGYHVISLDYKNIVISTICAHSTDSSCCDRFRKEIITGMPVSGKVEVDNTNSLLHRFGKMLSYLVKNDPGGGWEKFIKNGQPRWNRIITAGHSQGAGHAAYLGKMFKVSRVLIFSGPQDYLDDLQMPAPWLSMKSATSTRRYFAFLHLKDPFNVKHQIANCTRLLNKTPADTLMVRPGIPVQGHNHILVNDIAKDAHSSTIYPEFQNVWKYMLGIK